MNDIVHDLRSRLRIPAIVAPMFLISGPDLVIASAKAGLIAAFPAANARTIDDLTLWLGQISEETQDSGRDGMWAISMIVHASYDRFEAELDLIRQHRPRIVITALGSPARVRDQVHDFGGLVFSDVISPSQARKAADAGADGLVLVTNGAGGHTGQYNPFAFVEEVRSFWDGPLALAGGIGSGRAMHAAIVLGADFAYIGTRFIAARESLVTDPNRDMLVRAKMEDIVTTQAVTGIASNWMKESLDNAGFTREMLAIPAKIDFADMHGNNKAWKNIWGAGHAVSTTRAIQTVAEIVSELEEEYRASGAVTAI